MKIAIIILALLLLTGTASMARTDSADAGPIDTSHAILIELDEGIAVHWDTVNATIVRDSLFHELKGRAASIRDRLIELMADDGVIGSSPCVQQGELRRGGLAYMILNTFYYIPWFKVFRIQFHTLSFECPFPLGLIDYVQRDVVVAQEKLRAYLIETESLAR